VDPVAWDKGYRFIGIKFAASYKSLVKTYKNNAKNKEAAIVPRSFFQEFIEGFSSHDPGSAVFHFRSDFGNG
jgi:hypothetical protein